MQKTKDQKKKQKDENADPNKPKKPASSFILFRFSSQTSTILEDISFCKIIVVINTFDI
jgi:upstream-binding transcription factor